MKSNEIARIMLLLRKYTQTFTLLTKAEDDEMKMIEICFQK